MSSSDAARQVTSPTDITPCDRHVHSDECASSPSTLTGTCLETDVQRLSPVAVPDDVLNPAWITDEVWIGAMTVSTRGALLLVMALTAASRPLLAQRWICYAIHQGDTAAHVAIRITGSAHNRHEPWFQILDSAESRFVAKARYDHIRPGWQACVPSELVASAPRQATTTWADATARLPATLSRLTHSFPGSDPVWAVAVLVLTIVFVGYAADRYWKDRQAVVDVLTRFGEMFVQEFERPLIESRAPERALRSRLRLRPHQGQVDVLLAPAGARRYPNVFDHQKNVAYDTERVLQVLRHPPFVSGPPHQHGEWVVIPFQFKVRERQECAS